MEISLISVSAFLLRSSSHIHIFLMRLLHPIYLPYATPPPIISSLCDSSTHYIFLVSLILPLAKFPHATSPSSHPYNSLILHSYSDATSPPPPTLMSPQLLLPPPILSLMPPTTLRSPPCHCSHPYISLLPLLQPTTYIPHATPPLALISLYYCHSYTHSSLPPTLIISHQVIPPPTLISPSCHSSTNYHISLMPLPNQFFNVFHP